MIFIGGISQGQRILDYVQTVICDRCGRYGRYQIIMTYMYFSFFFIPVFKWNKRFYIKMTCCGAVYELNPDVGKAILRGSQTEISKEDMTLAEVGNERGAQGDSPQGPWKRCGGCGYETREDFEFCPKCGNKL